MIDWPAVFADLGFRDSDVEDCIHELAHVVDCSGTLEGLTSLEVDVLILETYGDAELSAYTKSSDMAEIRASAITKLVMEDLGLLTTDVLSDIESRCILNLSSGKMEDEKVADIFRLAQQDIAVKANAHKIAQYCREFPEEEDDE